MSEANLTVLYSNKSFSTVPELSQTHSANVQPVQKNLTLVQLHQTEQGKEECGLAGSCAPDDAHLLPRSHYEAHSIQGVRKTISVSQNHIAELQPTLCGPDWVQLWVDKTESKNERACHYGIIEIFSSILKTTTIKNASFCVEAVALIEMRLLLWSDLFVLVLWLGGEVIGVFLSSLHTNQLHLSLGEVEYESREQHGDGEGVGERQTHQAWKEQQTTY